MVSGILLADHRSPPLVCRPLDWDLTSADALRLVRDDAHPAALMGTWAGGSDVICSEPLAVRCPPELVWDLLSETWPAQTAAGRSPPSFGGGWIGYLGFGLAGQTLPVPPPPGGGSATTIACFAVIATLGGGFSRPCGRRNVPPTLTSGSRICVAGGTPRPGSHAITAAAISARRRLRPSISRLSAAPSSTSGRATCSRRTSACGWKPGSTVTRWTRSAVP